MGSWEVDQGPSWTTQPTAMSGQDAAAFLFGGVAASYVISTVDSNPANIDNQSWVSVFGPVGWQKVAQDYVASTGGLYQSVGDTSAYVDDNAVGLAFTNFAFIADVPEPASMALFGGALLGLGALRRRTSANA